MFQSGLKALRDLSNAAQEDLNKYLKFLISNLSKGMNQKPLKQDILDTLAVLEQNVGTEAYKYIK